MDAFDEYFPYILLMICVGAAIHIPACLVILMALLLFIWFVVFPIFILIGINAIFGGEVCFIVILLAIAIGIYYLFYTGDELK